MKNDHALQGIESSSGTGSFYGIETLPRAVFSPHSSTYI